MTSRELLARSGRGRVRRCDAARATRTRSSSFCSRTDSRARRRRSRSSAAASTTCRWRSSSPQRAPSCSRRAQLLERLGQRLDLLRGGRDAEAATADATGDDRVVVRPARQPEEQQLFARLSVFAAAVLYEAAEEICDADASRLCSRSLDKSLVRAGYDLGESLLDARDDPRVRRRASPSDVRRGRVSSPDDMPSGIANFAERLEQPLRLGDPDADGAARPS